MNGALHRLAVVARCGIVAVLFGAASAAIVGCWNGGDDPPEGVKTDLVVEQGKIIVDGRSFRFPCKTDELLDVLGEPSRREEHAAEGNRPDTVVMVWDERGIRCVEEPREHVISYLALVLDAGHRRRGPEADEAIRPSGDFRGTIRLAGADVRADATPESLSEQIADRRFTQSATFPFIWSMVYYDATVTVETDDAGKSIVEFSLRR